MPLIILLPTACVLPYLVLFLPGHYWPSLKLKRFSPSIRVGGSAGPPHPPCKLPRCVEERMGKHIAERLRLSIRSRAKEWKVVSCDKYRSPETIHIQCSGLLVNVSLGFAKTKNMLWNYCTQHSPKASAYCNSLLSRKVCGGLWCCRCSC